MLYGSCVQNLYICLDPYPGNIQNLNHIIIDQHSQLLTLAHASSMRHWISISYVCHSPGASPAHSHLAPLPAGESGR